MRSSLRAKMMRVDNCYVKAVSHYFRLVMFFLYLNYFHIIQIHAIGLMCALNDA